MMEEPPGNSTDAIASPKSPSVEVISVSKKRGKTPRKVKKPIKVTGQVDCELQNVKVEASASKATGETSSDIVSVVTEDGPPKKKSRKKKSLSIAEVEEQPPETEVTPKQKSAKKKKGTDLDFLKNMDRSPEKRKVNVTTKAAEGEESEKKSEKWTRAEKRKLLQALEKFGASDWTNLLQSVPTKSQEQIEKFYSSLGEKFSGRKSCRSLPKAPIEFWLEAAETLTMFDHDYSSILPQILTMAGYLEPHDLPRIKSKDPDWSRVYHYLANLMGQEKADPSNLAPIEAAVILDLLQNLSDHLNSLNTGKQRELMQLKYNQVTSNADLLKKHGQEQAMYHALDKDPLVDSIPAYVPGNQSTMKKSKLLSINPFSIPVKYLRPSPLQ